MSDYDLEPTLPNRRLSIRNSRLSAPQIPLSHGYSRRRRSSSGGGLSPLRRRVADTEGDEQEWESEDEPKRAVSPSYLFAHQHHRRGRSSDGSGKYIEYLEKQVVDLTSQLQGYTSATESTSHAAKMRKLDAENRTMRQDILEWETQFEQRVKEEAEERRMLNMSLRETVEGLENRLEEAECQLRIANAEVKLLKKECKRLKGIEEENHRLEFRVETLTDLLADSTATAQRRSSPADDSQSPCLIYPGGRRLSSFGGSAPGSAAMSRRVSRESGSFRGIEDYRITDPIDIMFDVHRGLDSRPRSQSASSHASSNYSSRRRLSFAAGTQPPRSPMLGQTSPTLRARRMRKFAAGSSAPKALMLPSAAVVESSSSLPGSPARRMSVGSDTSRPNFENMRNVTCPSSHRNSLFAELSAVLSDSEIEESELEEDTAPPTDNHPEEDTTILASTAPSSPHTKASEATEATTAAFTELHLNPPPFNLISDDITNPTPLIVKVLGTVGEGLSSPTRTFFSAKRKAIDIVGNVVAPRRTQAAISKRTRRSVSGIFSDPPPPSLRNRKIRDTPACAECGARKPDSARNTLSEEGSVWKRASGYRKRSGSMTQPVEDGIDMLWLWFRFIIAVVVALGLAVKDGPPTLGHTTSKPIVILKDDEGIDHVREEERERALKRLEGRKQ